LIGRILHETGGTREGGECNRRDLGAGEEMRRRVRERRERVMGMKGVTMARGG